MTIKTDNVVVATRSNRKTANSTTPESQVVNAVKLWAKTKPDVYLVRVVQAGESGVADFLMCMRGRFVAIECKATGKKPRDLQIIHGIRAENAGGTFLWGDTEALIPQLNALYEGLKNG